LPFHNGRWARKENLGWVWQPAVTAFFRPGEVYWLRGASFTGWGPLAPGELWTPPSPGAIVPQAFPAGSSTYAAFQPDVRAIDPAGFPAPSAEQLQSVVFVPALPSPAFLVSRLDAARPVLQVGSTRVTPSVSGVTFGDTPTQAPDITANAVSDAPPPPAIVTDGSLAAPTPPDGAYAVPVAVLPVAVPVAINSPAPQAGQAASPATPPSAVATNPPKPPSHPQRPVHDHPPVAGNQGPRVAPMASAELENYRQVLQDVNPAAPNFAKALADLNAWTRNFPVSASQNDRQYYYIHVYNAMGRADQVLDTAAPLVSAGVAASYRDTGQVLQILVAAASSLDSLAKPTAQQFVTGQSAARQLLDFLPGYFSPRSKPANVSDAAWSQARAQLETVARQALARKPVALPAVN
jgi:hypothetical protein